LCPSTDDATDDDQDKLPKALDLVQQALMIARSIGDRPGQAFALANLGDLFVRMGQWATAEANFKEAITLSESLCLRDPPSALRLLPSAFCPLPLRTSLL
jgi:tetratricopeptide (TPR) repeat protein